LKEIKLEGEKKFSEDFSAEKKKVRKIFLGTYFKKSTGNKLTKQEKISIEKKSDLAWNSRNFRRLQLIERYDQYNTPN